MRRDKDTIKFDTKTEVAEILNALESYKLDCDDKLDEVDMSVKKLINLLDNMLINW